jgi:hypothetical protein
MLCRSKNASREQIHANDKEMGFGFIDYSLHRLCGSATKRGLHHRDKQHVTADGSHDIQGIKRRH